MGTEYKEDQTRGGPRSSYWAKGGEGDSTLTEREAERGRVDPKRVDSGDGEDDAEREDEHALRHGQALPHGDHDGDHDGGEDPVSGQEDDDEERDAHESGVMS